MLSKFKFLLIDRYHMRVLIVGAGRIGSSLAQNLANEKNDVTVVDVDPIALAALRRALLIYAPFGDASSPRF